jgi:hemin uptake protein HemP
MDTVSREVNSMELLKGAHAITIVHGGLRYVLRHTRQGKLILTK